MLPHLTEREQFVEMFFREATVASGINHPNVVQIFELGEHDGTYFIAMEYVDGISLRDLAKEAKREGVDIPNAIWVRAIADAAAGLHAAHTLVDDAGEPLNVVHRDISPDNLIMGRSGVTKILDFGVAKALASEDSLTESGEIKGKLPFMAPEQIEDAPLDSRSDLYALGISLFWLLSGQGPFHRSSQVATIKAVLEDDPPSLPLLNPTVSTEVDWIISQLLMKDREERPSNGAALREMLLNASPEAERPDYTAVRELIEGRRARHAAAREETTLAMQSPSSTAAPGSTLADAAADETVVTVATHGTIAELHERRRSLRWAGLSIVGAAFVFVIALAAMAALDRDDDATVSGPTKASQAPDPPTPPVGEDFGTNLDDPDGDEVIPHEVAELVEPAEPVESAESAAPTKKPARKSIAVAGPKGLTWVTSRGEKLRVRNGKVSAPPSARSLLAVHPQLGGRVRVPISKGRADYGAVPTGRATFRVQPFATVHVGSRKLGMTPLDGPLILPAGSYSARLVGEQNTIKRKLTIKAGRETVVRVNMSEP
jgi:serine/threonine-protein kinase